MDATEFLRRQVISLAYRQLSAAELMTRASAGDVEAYIALVCLKFPVVAAVSRGVLGPVAAVEDVAQEVFVQLWRQREGIRSADAIDGWLAQTARNLALKLVTRESQQQAVGVEWWQRRGRVTETDLPDAAALVGELEQRLRQLIATRPGQEQQVLRAAEHAEGDAQAAASLGLSVNSYRVRLHRARQKLRRLLEKAGLLPGLVVGATVGGARRAGAAVAALWARRLGKVFLVTCVLTAGVAGGVAWQAQRVGPVAERHTAPVPTGGPVETLQARNLRIARDEVAGGVRDIFQKFYPPPHAVEVSCVRAFGSEVEVELRVTPPPPAITQLAAVSRGRYCVFRRKLRVDSQPAGQTGWYRMNSEKPIAIKLPSLSAAGREVVRGREEYAATERLFDRLPKDDRAEAEQLRQLFGPPGGEVLLPTGGLGTSSFPDGMILSADGGGLYVRDGAGSWRYAGECPGWFPVVADGQVFCFESGVIRSRPLAEPTAPWVRRCDEPPLGPGDRATGELFVAGGRLCMAMEPHGLNSRPLADPAAGWVRTTHPVQPSGFAVVGDSLYGKDVERLFERPAGQLDAAWVPAGPWPAGCLWLVADGTRLLAYGRGPGPIYARPVGAAADVPWTAVGRVHDPYQR
ncbi:RNA polymerase sigma factor [Urbifossiella limnaea]|uniref:ECF RNA polymerase sigma-E factor n=1 Tax=Urbifossiella limnaea TaxID=2528023 RepID=A0A517XWN2_9BACT|nr:RNA polymerase sigma factor [Urbifossiella limnaea]QDU21913.1 ECF RNA polymerase sigma-E factor [Urbifossiella limnaea]